jgi:hypothetical protein
VLGFPASATHSLLSIEGLSMDLEKTFNTINDYSKFLVTLWAGYIGITTAAIGWLITLRGGKPPLDWTADLIVIAAYILVSFIFHRVLCQYHDVLKKLMKLADELAKDEADRLRTAAANNLPSQPIAAASCSVGALLELFDRHPRVRALDDSLKFVWYVAGIVSAIMLAVKFC